MTWRGGRYSCLIKSIINCANYYARLMKYKRVHIHDKHLPGRSCTHMQRMLNSRHMTEAGPLSMLSDDDDIIDSDEGAPNIKLPGVRKGTING